MKVEPAAADLLVAARATILGELVSALPESRRYEALMVANALAIAGREMAAPSTTAAEIASLAGLLADWRLPKDEQAALREGTARLAARIREGHFDQGEARVRLLAHLRETARARLSVSNPRALARGPGTPP